MRALFFWVENLLRTADRGGRFGGRARGRAFSAFENRGQAPPAHDTAATSLTETAEGALVAAAAGSADEEPPNMSCVDAWRRIIVGEGKSWVVFRHGTSSS
jgi:hypothetical protein